MTVAGVETRAAVELRADGSTLAGIAAPYLRPSEDLGGFRETIIPGAFRSALAEGADVLALYDHDRGQVLGRTRSGTLRLEDTSEGLAFAIDAPGTTTGRDVLALVQRGDLAGASFGFRVRRQRWRTDERGRPLRELVDVELLEVSIVSSPAYADTTVARRSLEAGQATARRRRYMEARYGLVA